MHDPDSTVELVVRHLREGIIDGTYQPESKLQPKVIAEKCGTSFIPVREAFRILESEGFVTVFHNRGAWVSSMSVEDLDDLYSIRTELECEAVRRASSCDEKKIDVLLNNLGEAQERHAKGDHAAVVTLNREFHFAIYELAGSPRRLKLIDQLWLHSARYQRLSLHYRHDAASDEHRLIVDSLSNGDHSAAAEALRCHLASTFELIRGAVEAASFVGREDRSGVAAAS